MGILNKVKKGSTKKSFEGKIHKEEISKESKEQIHYLKGNVKDIKKQMQTKDSLVLKNEALAILHSGPKNYESFLFEFEKLAREGYMLTGTTLTKGLPFGLFGFEIKTGILFYFQHTKFFSNKSP
jgi:hypothetical protein